MKTAEEEFASEIISELRHDFSITEEAVQIWKTYLIQRIQYFGQLKERSGQHKGMVEAASLIPVNFLIEQALYIKQSILTTAKRYE